MEYQLIRSRRKTIAICIGRGGEVTVRAPLHAADCLIERFVAEKQRWICEKSLQMRRLAEEQDKFRVSPGSFLPLLGEHYPVKEGTAVSFDGDCFYVPKKDENDIRPQLESFYREAAQRVILERVAYFSGKTGIIPAGVRVGRARTSWGSCSGKNRLSFSWRLVFAAPEELDYVVIHELAHIREHNHSARFWALVGSLMPDYRARHDKLRKLGRDLQKFHFS